MLWGVGMTVNLVLTALSCNAITVGIALTVLSGVGMTAAITVGIALTVLSGVGMAVLHKMCYGVLV